MGPQLITSRGFPEFSAVIQPDWLCLANDVVELCIRHLHGTDDAPVLQRAEGVVGAIPEYPAAGVLQV